MARACVRRGRVRQGERYGVAVTAGPVLTRFERGQLEAICDALIPSGGPLPEGALDVGVPGRIESWLDGFSPAARRLVRLMLVGHALTPLGSRHPRLFGGLDAAGRERWLAATDASRLRLRKDALTGLRTLVTIAFTSTPEVSARIGYDGSPVIPVDWAALGGPRALPVTTYPDIAGEELGCDVVIAGSGAGGSIVALELARAGLEVVVVEEGPLVGREDVRGKRPVERLFAAYRDQGLTSTLGTPVISLPMGRAVGGTTVVNSGTCFRTPERVLGEWAATGIPDIDPESMAPLFDAVEELIGVAPVPEATLGPNGRILRDGAEALGYSHGPIRRNARGCHGHGACAFICPIDAKQAMHVSVLPDAVAAGARVIAGCRVRSVQVEAGRATGVTADVLDPQTNRRRGSLRIHARAVVLAAGAVFTPTLLLRQRLANSSRQVGRNLVIHPGVGTTAEFDEELWAWKGVMQGYHCDQLIDDGVLLESTFPPPGLGYSAGAIPGVGREFKELFAAFPRMAACGSVISDAPSGRVRLMPGLGAGIRYTLAAEDARKVLKGIALACDIYLAAGARRVFAMLPGLREVTTRAQVEQIRHGRWAPGELKLSAYHPMGTCRMGVDPHRSVVDAYGQCHDVPGLWVLDASIMPSSTVVNPQVTIMSLAMRGARRLAGSLA